MRRNILLLFVASALLAMGGQARAQGTGGASASDLDTLVVTASRFVEEKREVTSNISVIDREFIENSSAVDLADVLGAYGLQVMSDHGYLTQVSMRGFTGDAHGFELGGQVTVLVDGRRTMTGNISKIVSSNIERVEIIRGPVAAQYGPSAMGGVINVITRRGTGEKPFSVEAKAGVGSFDYRDAVVSFSGEKGGFDYFASFDWSSRGDIHLPDGRVYPSTRWSKKSASTLNLGYSFGEHRVGFAGTFFDVNTNFAGRLTAWNPRHSDRKNSFGELNYQGAALDGRLSWSARFGLGNDDENYIGLRTPSFSRYYTHAQIGSGQMSYDQGMFVLTAGVDYAYYDMTQTWAPLETDTTNKAVYVIGKLRFLDDSLIFSLGGRYDWYRLRDKDVRVNRSRSDKNFSPSIGVAWLPAPWIKLRAHYAEAFLMPTVRQLYIDTSSYVGNPDLKPETSKTWEIGADLSWQGINFGVTLFRTDSEDLITTGQLNGRATLVNIGKALREGVELEASYDFGRLIGEGYSLRPYANLNFMTKFRDRDTGRKLNDVPTLAAGYGVSFYTPGNDFSASVRARYVGVFYNNPTNTYPKPEYGRYNVVDLAMSKKLADLGAGGSVAIKVSVNNLFNRYYEASKEYPSAGRNFYVGLAYSY
ncbi:MAG: TonB-dependent receptor [Deltaproteobacteria bacterium]|nr:TonB-dependent receptor [Deltaproteobacteria bacterium]